MNAGSPKQTVSSHLSYLLLLEIIHEAVEFRQGWRTNPTSDPEWVMDGPLSQTAPVRTLVTPVEVFTEIVRSTQQGRPISQGYDLPTFRSSEGNGEGAKSAQ